MISFSSPSPRFNVGFRFSSYRVRRKFSVACRRASDCDLEEIRIIKPENKQVQSTKSKTETISNCEVSIFNSEKPQNNKSTPLLSALKDAAEENAASFHFPGHNRGRAAPSSLTQLIGKRPFLHDLPELPELDNLFAPEGPILDAQRRAAELFGASETWFLVGGTTCGIQASVMATCGQGDTIVLPRNCHVSVIAALVLSGAVPRYVFPEYDSEWDLAAAVSPRQVEKAIQDLESEGKNTAAVLVTSPTYHGVCSNLKQISDICHVRSIPLIVDEAHGAHFGFHPELPISALQQGADLTIQSTHKVLCSLTQSSMLHRSGNIVDQGKICRCLQTLQTTSPSYLLLASLDATRAQISQNADIMFRNAIQLATEAKNLIREISGIRVLDSSKKAPEIDPLRVTIGVRELGISGNEADEFLYRNHGVVSELIGPRCITFVFTPGTQREHVQRLVLGFEHLSSSFSTRQGTKQRLRNTGIELMFDDIEMKLTPREAFFKRKRRVKRKESIGKVSGELVCSYPPGIPVLIPGEVIREREVEYLMELQRDGAVITGATDPLLSSIIICDV